MSQFGIDPYQLGSQVPAKLPGQFTINPTFYASACYITARTLTVGGTTLGSLQPNMTVNPTFGGIPPGVLVRQQTSPTTWALSRNLQEDGIASGLGPIAISAGFNLLPIIANLPVGTEAYCTDLQGNAIWTGSEWVSSARNLFARIRNSMTQAKGNNPVESLPWTTMQTLNVGGGLQTRANSTAYVQGNTYLNAAGTHWFVVRVSGTSAASEPATVTTPIVAVDPYNMGDITDGTATVNWMGPVRVSAAQPGAPTITGGAKATQLTQQVYVSSGSGSPVAGAVANTTQFRFLNGSGGFNSVGLATQALVRGSSTTSGLRSTQFTGNYTLPTFGGNMIEFTTDAPLIAMDIFGAAAFPNGLFAGQGLYIEIDGRRLCDGMVYPTVQLTQNNAYQVLDFRSAGPRKNRTIRIGVNNVGTFSYIWVTPEDTITVSQNPNRYNMAVVGDSEIFGSNSSPILVGGDMVTQFAELIGCDTFANLGVGGTGFVYNGAGLTYIQRIADVINLNPDVVWIQGAYNDSTNNGVTAAQLQPAALLYYQTLRGALPTAMIIQAGTTGGVTPTVLQALDNALQAAVTQFNDPFTFFVPASTATPPWISGTGWLGGTNGSGNSDIYVGPTDTTHPSQMGVAYIATKMAQGFQNLIYSLSPR